MWKINPKKKKFIIQYKGFLKLSELLRMDITVLQEFLEDNSLQYIINKVITTDIFLYVYNVRVRRIMVRSLGL